MSRRYIIRHDDREYEVLVEREGQQIAVEHDGKRYLVQPVEEAPQIAPVALSQPPHSSPPTATTATHTAGAPPESPQSGAIGAPMPGVIREIRVQVGDRVGKGETVIVMEAMKMELEVSAQVDGAVSEILTQVGASVSRDQPLVRFG